MRHNLIANLKEIKKYYSSRLSNISRNQRKAINDELKEWIRDSFNGNENIWTLPDLTSEVRLGNFCRSIKKKIH